MAQGTWLPDSEANAKLQAQAEQAALASVNPEGGHFNLIETVKKSLEPTARLLGLDRSILNQKLDPNRDPNYHGETSINELQEGLSNLAKGTSDFLEGHWWGRNFKGNIKNWTKMAIGAAEGVSDYAKEEATLGGQSTPGQWGAWALGNVLIDRERYSQGLANQLGKIKLDGKGIDPRLLKFGTEEVFDTLLSAGAAGWAKGATKAFAKIPNLPTGGSLVPVGAGIYDIPYDKLDEGFKPSTVFEITTSPELRARGAYQGIAGEPAWISRLAQQKKVVDRRSAGRMDPLDDAQSFLHEPRFGRSFYGVSFDKLPLKMRQDVITLMNNTGEQVQWHHWNPKLHTAERNRRMIQLIKEGKADWDDYVNLHLVAEQMNAASGGGISGLGAIHKSFHTDVHKWLRSKGLEHTGKPREKIRAHLSKMNTADELVIDLLRDIDLIVKPTKRMVRKEYKNMGIQVK